MCQAYTLCLLRRDAIPSGSVLNIASGQPRRVGEVLAELLVLAGVQAEVATDPSRLRPSEIPFAVGDAGLARRTLGWAPTIPWQQTLSEMLAEWRSRAASDPA